MRDFSINLPSWACNEGYRLKGGSGTYDELFLLKNGKLVYSWRYTDKVPNLVELEEFLGRLNSSTSGI